MSARERNDFATGTGALESVLGLEWSKDITNREAKERIASEVASIARDGDVTGVGSGSTSFLTVLALGQRVSDDDLSIRVVPTSIEIELACRAVGLRVEASVPRMIDWSFDGADEVDPSGRLIKGRGGAVHRERHVFATADRRYVVADASKSVSRLGSRFPVPVEVEPSMIQVVHSRLSKFDKVIDVKLRMAVAKDGPVITEAGRVLFDVRMSGVDLEDEAALLATPGVCCSGIFSGFDFERLGE